MTTPREAAKGLGVAQKAHIMHGIGGAPYSLLDSLERRGIVEESEREPGHLELSAIGMCVRTLLRGYDPEAMNDEQRINYREAYGEFAPEWEECDQHPGHGQVYEWAYDVPASGDRQESIVAIECSEPNIIDGCPLCNAEAEARWGDE